MKKLIKNKFNKKEVLATEKVNKLKGGAYSHTNSRGQTYY